MTLRVAMVGLRAPWGAEGGIEQVVGELAPRLAALGCEVTVYCRRRYNPLGPGTHRGVRLVDVGTVYTKHLEAIVHTAAALVPATLGADVVHVHATGPASLSWLPRLAGRGTVVTVHGLDWQRDKWSAGARLALRGGAWAAGRFPHRCIVVGRHLADHYRTTYGVDATWIPNGVGEIAPVALDVADIEGLEPFGYLLYLGRLVPEKGLERLLAAYRQSGLTLPLVLVGGNTYSEDHAARLRGQASPGVVFTGSLVGERRDALLTHARAFVLPSRLEGFPVAALEALSAGRPVLLSDIPPHRELLAPAGEPRVPAGRLVELHEAADDVATWADALRDMATTDEDVLTAMGEAGRLHVRRHYSWSAIAQRTLEVYRAALAESRSPHG